MAAMPTNEKLLMVEGDDEAWVDTHHGMGRSHCVLCHMISFLMSHDIMACVTSRHMSHSFLRGNSAL